MAHSSRGQNPIYSRKFFADYRAKVEQKQAEKDEPKWPMCLEDPFLDALFLIPFMGRKKVSSMGKLYGRNMLISEYIWIRYWLMFPTPEGTQLPTGEEREEGPWKEIFRGRKQVSSHIQVLKGFFKTHPCFHFFFPCQEDNKKKSRYYVKEEEPESFKNNTVLIALADGRLPDERPNYEYFAQLMAGDAETFVMPKACWIYVSSSEVTLSSDYREAIAPDGTVLSADSYGPDGQRLESGGAYPHLLLNGNKDTRLALRSGREDEPPKFILHEYTKSLTQVDSSSIKDISAGWEHEFPELNDNLMSAVDVKDPMHERTSRCVVGPCDILHFEVVLGLHSTSRFPSGTHLEGSVQLQICRPELANHRWRSVTSVSKPEKLEHDASEAPFWNCHNPCDLVGRQRDVIEVPFPATSWASTFIMLSKYVTAERERLEKERKERRSKVKTEEGGEGSEDKHGSGKKSSSKIPTPQDLLDQVAMYQEIWSAPNDGSEKPNWTRRSVILWTFAREYREVNSKGKNIGRSPGTSWRFLTKVDPLSQEHRQRTLVSGPQPTGPPVVPRDAVMSPNPAYANHYATAAMHENFNTASYQHDSSSSSSSSAAHHHAGGGGSSNHIDFPGQSLHSYNPSSLGLLDGFSCLPSGGLATPPPSTSLSSSGYAHSFDSATIASTDSLHHHVSFPSDGSGTGNDSSQSTLVGSGEHHSHHQHHPQADFLANLGVSGAYDDDPTLIQPWATGASSGGLGALDQWATTYVDSHNSMAWAEHAAAAVTAAEDGSRDATPWGDGKDTLWASNSNNSNNASSSSAADIHAGPAISIAQHHGSDDVWAATSHSWLQSIAATADANSTAFHHHHHDASSAWEQQSQVILGLSSAPSRAHDLDDVHPKEEEQQPEPVYSSRKRARADEDDEDEAARAIRRLAQHDDGTGAPTANMFEDDHGSLFDIS
ncbi:hypothetical protein KJ359_006417 [Pestalotiopsis sp. 9143b]|nr:hypothetical protein KJ359_006417 [Pestalotiopsis sp. 9143b]